jgi:hypothetical protein
MLVLGDILYCKEPVGQQLLSHALHHFQNGLPPISVEEARQLRGILMSRIKTAHSAEFSDPASQNMTISTAVLVASQTGLRLSRVWRGKPHQYLDKLRIASPVLADHLENAMDMSAPVKDRLSSLRSAAGLLVSDLRVIISTADSPSENEWGQDQAPSHFHLT